MISMLELRLILLVLFLMVIIPIWADPEITSAETTKITDLGYAIQDFAGDHAGRLPSTWQELDKYNVSKSYDTLKALDKAYGGGSIVAQYLLVPSSLPSQELQGGQVVAIGRIDGYDNGEKGRFIISRSKGGAIECQYYSEKKIQKILAETHIVVPPPVVTPSGNPQLSSIKNTQLQENSATPPTLQTAFPENTSSVFTTPSQAPKTIAELAPPIYTGIPLWLSGFSVLIVAVIAGGGWLVLQRSKK